MPEPTIEPTDQWGYMKVNGKRVNAARYHHRLRVLRRQAGRTAVVRTTRTGPPSAQPRSHWATLVLVQPSRNRAYPTLEWVLHCGAHTPTSVQHAPGRPTCKTCQGRRTT